MSSQSPQPPATPDSSNEHHAKNIEDEARNTCTSSQLESNVNAPGSTTPSLSANQQSIDGAAPRVTCTSDKGTGDATADYPKKKTHTNITDHSLLVSGVAS